MTARAHPLLAGIVALAVCLPLAACAAPAPTAAPSAAVSLDEVAVVAEVYRSRIDPARGGIQLSVRNEGAAPLTIVRAVLESPALAAPIERDRETAIGPGLTRDLAMTLTSAACPASTTRPPDALLTVALADGGTAELRVPTTDRLGQWTEWLDAECFAAAVLERAAITVRHDPARDAAGGAAGPLIGLALEVDTRAPGLELVAANDTVLFGLVRASDGARVTGVALDGLGAHGSGSAEGAVSIPLLLTPARCDAHALADDKQGTLFRIDVRLDGEPGTVTIAADPATRAALYDAFTRACSL
ncbi:MAG: hypothetical protein B7Y93_01550 [Micrococcales bacterium 32-70-13]|nr:MAG: hypothetical protein B7Y93_01550 [Micrococcales bacterium 32-70-13]